MIDNVTLALSIFLLALGAALVWGVQYEAAGLRIDLIGVILLAAGTIGALLAAATYARNRPANRAVRRDYLEH